MSEYFFAEFPPAGGAATASRAPVPPARTAQDVPRPAVLSAVRQTRLHATVAGDAFGAAATRRIALRIAQVAARLIAEHGITDWSLAKRKAARQLMLPEREALPGDDEIAGRAGRAPRAVRRATRTTTSCARSARRRCVWMRRLARVRART